MYESLPLQTAGVSRAEVEMLLHTPLLVEVSHENSSDLTLGISKNVFPEPGPAMTSRSKILRDQPE